MWKWFSRPTPLQQPIIQYEQAKRPSKQTALTDCPLMLVDIETTGLDVQKHQMISIGWLMMHQRTLDLASARYLVIRPPTSDKTLGGVGQSATIHGIHNQDLAAGEELADVLLTFLQAAEQAVLVAHHSVIEQQFLRKACQNCFGRAPNFKFLDTLQIEARQLQRRNITVRQDEYRLAACLKRHQLPMLQEHNALEDAFGCGLLLQKQMATLGADAVLGDLFT
jgi:DNA polymerase-3 subunit epsilon